MNVGSKYKSLWQKYIVSFNNSINYYKKRRSFWFNHWKFSSVTVTEKMQMFENKVNTSKKEQNSRALMIERITYKMNFKFSVSSNWLKLTDLEKRSTTIRSVEGPSELHFNKWPCSGSCETCIIWIVS